MEEISSEELRGVFKQLRHPEFVLGSIRYLTRYFKSIFNKFQIMKNDPILSALINFLVPIIFLYGLFFLADFFESGFFAFIYSVVLFVSGFMIFSVKFSNMKMPSLVHFEFFSFFALLLSISYLVAILFFITNVFAI